MEEYIDVFSEKYTKMWKSIAFIRYGIKLFLSICVVVFLITLTYGLAPYIKGTEVWEEMPFTLSQLEALLSLLLMCYLCRKSIKVI